MRPNDHNNIQKYQMPNTERMDTGGQLFVAMWKTAVSSHFYGVDYKQSHTRHNCYDNVFEVHGEVNSSCSHKF